MTTTATTKTTTRCLVCNRPLRTPKSVKLGYGPTCKAKLHAAATVTDLSLYKPAQVDKARELLTDGGLVPTSRPGLYTAVSSDGTTHYLTQADRCTCPAGQNGRNCYHRAAAAILDTARPTRRTA